MSGRDIAIIGMACVFPKAPDLAAYWHNLRTGVDAITDVPPQRWDSIFYDPTSMATDRFYARRGGFIDGLANFDAAAHGLMPVAAKGAEPDQLMALQVAVNALADAGYAERSFPRETTGIILGRGNYPGPAIVRLGNMMRGAEQLIATLSTLLPELSPEKLMALKKGYQARCGAYGPDTAIGLVPNLVASRIANRLDLGGSAYTIDAACASTLVAVDQACRELRDGAADMVLSGGVHLCHDVALWSVFSQLGALSHSDQIRPFHQHADGLLIGEGVGILVLRRLADAEKANDRIYAVIRGTGVASDGRDVSLLTPQVDGQVLALTRAWKAAGMDPATVGLVEAHGTATPAGDAAELATLVRIFGAAKQGMERVPLGSVKSMIGHAMPAAGAAGLIKAALAVYHGVRPPTLHCDEPNTALQATRFRMIGEAEPWYGTTRCAAVNAFGFGGINAHVILDAPTRAARSVLHVRPTSGTTAALVLAAKSQAALLAALNSGQRGGDGSWRLVVLDPTSERLEVARAAVEAGRRRPARDGIFFSPSGLLSQGGKLAFLFPGVEAAFAPRIEGVAEHFDMAPPELVTGDLERQGVSVARLNRFMADVAGRTGLVPDAIAGHSIGEWSGMWAARMFANASVDEFTAALDPGSLQVVPLTYVAVGAGADRITALFPDLKNVTVSHDNCVHQSILCGPQDEIAEVVARLREQRILHEILPFRSGFHSPALVGHVDFYRDHLARLQLCAPAIPLWSATTCAPYPSDPVAITELFIEHLVQPVRFRELILALYRDGVRAFVQVGTGSTIAFVDDVLVGKPHCAVSMIATQRDGMDQLRHAAAALYVEGAAIDLPHLLENASAVPTAASRALQLDLSFPLVHFDAQALRAALPASPNPVRVGHPLFAEFDAVMRETMAAQQSVAQAFSATVVAATPACPSAALAEQLVVSVDTFPELLDHCLIPQREGWPAVADRAPTAPMTMAIALLMEAAKRFDPHRVAIAVEDIAARAWLYAEPAAQLAITCERVGPDKIRVVIDRHFDGTVTMADRFPEPPPPLAESLRDAKPYPIPMDEIYRDRWLFHGPLYQGIVDIDTFSPDGMRGTLTALPAKGALLDAAGQLAGLWVIMANTEDRMSMPVRISSIQFFGPEPAPGDRFTCTVWNRSLGRREVRSDFELTRNGVLYARVTAWEGWRFPTGGPIFPVLRQPDKNLLAAPDPDGFVVLHDPGWSSKTVEFLIRRFLSSREIEQLGGVRQVQRRTEWLSGRIAAKDAVRNLLFQAGLRSVFPLEIGIGADATGRPRVTGPLAGDIRISIAHKPGIAVAIAREGVDVGIDVEKIEPRNESFAAFAFSEDELRLLPAGSRDEWLTRFWSAKEATGKSHGTGLAGNPKGFKVRQVEGERILVDATWVSTRNLGTHVMAWTAQ